MGPQCTPDHLYAANNWEDTTFNKQELVKKVAKLIAAQVDEFAKEDYFTELYEEAALEIINLVIDETTEP